MGAEPLRVPAGELGAFPSALEPFIAVDGRGVTVVNSDSHQHQRPVPSTLGVHTCRRRVAASLGRVAFSCRVSGRLCPPPPCRCWLPSPSSSHQGPSKLVAETVTAVCQV